MLYELLAYNTDGRYPWDVRYRAYTTSAKKAEAFRKIPKIQFSNSGHGIVFVARLVKGKQKTIGTLSAYVYENLHQHELSVAKTDIEEMEKRRL